MRKIKNLIMMHIGIVLLAMGVYFFKMPNGFSTGGVTGIGTLLEAITPISAGLWIWILNIGLLIVGFVFFGRETGLFSFLGLFAKAFIVDAVIENLNTCKYFVVITSKADEISNYILETIHHGVTAHGVVGEYTGKERAMLHTVCKRSEAIKLRSEIKKIDPSAFIIITTSSEIIGRGFRSV